MTNKKISKLRCIHRHSIHTHKNCFLKGRVLYNFKDEREYERLTGIPWYKYPDENGEPMYKIGFFDIEVDNLKPDFGTILSWAIKELDGEVITSVVTQEELMSGKHDERLVREFLEAIKNFDILVGYYSTRFDLPYMRSKALHYGYEFPGFSLQKNYQGKYYSRPELIHWDLYYVVRNKLGLSRNSLAVACSYLGIEGKDIKPIGGTVRRAKYGDPKAMKEVLEHNIADVEITELLFKKLQPYKKWIRRPA